MELPRKMTTDYRLFVAGIRSYTASKGYKKWSGLIENNKLPADSFWEIERPGKKADTQKSS